MLISNNSIINFISINTFLFTLAWIQLKLILYFPVYIVLLLRNYLLIYLIDYLTTNKKSIKKNQHNLSKISWLDHYNVFKSTITEVITYVIVNKLFIKKDLNNFFQNPIIFILSSFYFEIILDFFHYWTHRISHEIPILYKMFHKQHHNNKYPVSIQTFCHHPIDLIITNTIPVILTISLCPFSIGSSFWHQLLAYKSFVEISGHTSVVAHPSGSFPQFIWLPKYFNIQLFTEEHTLHHSLNNCNYSKRFSIWDKIFGTYKSYDYK